MPSLTFHLKLQHFLTVPMTSPCKVTSYLPSVLSTILLSPFNLSQLYSSDIKFELQVCISNTICSDFLEYATFNLSVYQYSILYRWFIARNHVLHEMKIPREFTIHIRKKNKGVRAVFHLFRPKSLYYTIQPSLKSNTLHCTSFHWNNHKIAIVRKFIGSDVKNSQ